MTQPNPFNNGGTKTAAAPAKKAAAKAPAARAANATTAAQDPTDAEEPTTLSAAQGRDPFATPSGGGSDYKIPDFVGELLLVRPDPTSVGEVMKTKISDNTEIVRVDVVRLDNENERIDDMLVFQTALLRTFKKVAAGPNNWTIGRLERGEEKNGRSAPYIFVRVEQDEIDRGIAVAKELQLDL